MWYHAYARSICTVLLQARRQVERKAGQAGTGRISSEKLAEPRTYSLRGITPDIGVASSTIKIRQVFPPTDTWYFVPTRCVMLDSGISMIITPLTRRFRAP